MSTEGLYICGKHVIPVMYRGDQCPWCQFTADVQRELEAEYKRGFIDGAQAVAKEAANDGRSPDK